MRKPDSNSQPGLVTASHPTHRYKPILAKSVEIYSQLEKETGEPVHFNRTGTVRLATNKRRVDEFKLYTARDYYRPTDSCRTELIDSARLHQLCPLLDTAKIAGALFTSGDGYLDAGGLTRALAKGAVAAGARIVENCAAHDIRPDGKQWKIETDTGTLTCANVVNAAGLWAKEVAHKSGFELPLVHIEHQWGGTSKLHELDALDAMPAVIDHEAPFYLRRSGDSLLFGAFDQVEHVRLRDDWTFDRMPEDGDVIIHPTFDRIRTHWEHAQTLMPILAKCELRPYAGVYCMTPDQFPLVGPMLGAPNYWVAAGCL